VGRVMRCEFFPPRSGPGFAMPSSTSEQKRLEKNWMVKIKPIHDVPGRNRKKGHWCSASNWRTISALEALALQAADD